MRKNKFLCCTLNVLVLKGIKLQCSVFCRWRMWWSIGGHALYTYKVFLGKALVSV